MTDDDITKAARWADRMIDNALFFLRAFKAGFMNLPKRMGLDQMGGLALAFTIIGGFMTVTIIFVFLGGHGSWLWLIALIFVALMLWEGMRLIDHPDHW